MRMTIDDLVVETEASNGLSTTRMCVGAVTSKVEMLKRALIYLFDSPPSVEYEELEWGTESYHLSGKIGGVQYDVYIECYGCPTPILSTMLHNAVVVVPQGTVDKLSPVVEGMFKSYRQEVTERERLVEKSIPDMNAAVANEKREYERRRRLGIGTDYTNMRRTN